MRLSLERATKSSFEPMSTAANPEVKTTPTTVETVTVKVNGRAVAVPKTMPDHLGKPVPTTMLQACQVAGVEVPHYCYHPKLPIAGNCRMCLVEYGLPMLGPDRKPLLNEDGTPKIAKQVLPYDPSQPRGVIACATPISPGMEIYADSPATQQMREGVLESLLINHPLDCPICDQAGECKLQEYSVEHGQATSRFVEEKVHKPKRVDLGPRIVLDDERCILCSRCVRFTRDIVGDDALGFVNRGSYNTLTHYPGKPFDNNYTLNTVDLCPVGALTSKDFRFKMRVWFLKETKSLCTSCGTGCNIVMGSREGQLHRYEPRQNDAVNSSWMCDQGRLNYKWIGRADRLQEVMIRRGNAPQVAGKWKVAMSEMTARLSGAALGSVAIIGSARQTTEELYLLAKLAKKSNALTDSVPRFGEADHLLVASDRNPNSTGARLTGISSECMGSKIPTIAAGIRSGSIKTLLVLGEDVTKAGIAPELLDKVECLIAFDILPNATTAKAHYLLPGCAHAEKRGTFINHKGRVQKFMKAVEPTGAARPEWEVLNELVFNGSGGPVSIEGLFNAMAQETPALAGVTWASLGDQGVTIAI